MQRRSMWWWVLLVCSVLVFVTLSSCDGDDDEDGEECFLVTEFEPNDAFETPDAYVTQAQDLGEMHFGDCFIITGDLIAEDDVSDGYGFFLSEEQALAITLSHSAVNDFDVIIFDATTGIRLATCSSELESEVCDASPLIGSIDVVVVPISGFGNYTLDIESF